MGLFSGDRQRATCALMELYRSRPMVTGRRDEWHLLLASMLRDRFTQERAEASSSDAKLRVEYLEVAEPAPLREDFLPPMRPLPRESVRVLAAVEDQFTHAWHAYTAREHWRVQELERAKHVYAQVSAAEAARRAQVIAAEAAPAPHGFGTRWPVDAVVDADVLAIDDIAHQVDVQNDRIEGQVDQLSNLLTYGLRDTPSRSSVDAGTDENPDPECIVESVESALSAMRLPPGFDTAARVAYSPDSRQVVVEFELPKETVIPKAKSYRWVKNREASRRHAAPRGSGEVALRQRHRTTDAAVSGEYLRSRPHL